MKNNKIIVSVCVPRMIIGGVETVLLNTLDGLAKYENLKIQVLMHSPLDLEYFKTWFAAHPEIDIFIQYPLDSCFDKLEKYTNIFPLKNIRKIVYSAYKKYRKLILHHSRPWHDTDVFIDYKNFAFHADMRYVKKPKITWAHGSVRFFEEERHARWLPSYDKMVCITDSFVREFGIKYPHWADKTLRIYNPIKYDYIADKAKNAPQGAGQYFCSVMRMDPDKDAETVIRAFNKFWLDNGQPNVRLILIGDGQARKQFEELAHKMDAAQNIIFTGTITEPYGYMRAALAHILSSNNEGMGMVLVEAAAAGTLNIASDCPNGPREILLDGRAGILFAPGNVDALARALDDVYNGRVDTDAMRTAATDALSRFDATHIATQIHSLICDMAK